MQNAFENCAVWSELRSPCKDCCNHFWFSQEDVYDHLVGNSPYRSFCNWIYEVSTSKSRKINHEMNCDTCMGMSNDFDKMIRDESRVKNGMNAAVKSLK